MNRTNEWTPRYHFYSNEEHNMPFDPNGMIFWKGRYHVFYLFQDSAVGEGRNAWGHASSADLVHWNMNDNLRFFHRWTLKKPFCMLY